MNHTVCKYHSVVIGGKPRKHIPVFHYVKDPYGILHKNVGHAQGRMYLGVILVRFVPMV